jgi:hypothetical protein
VSIPIEQLIAGSWVANKRVGIYKIVDGEGVLWTEKYDDDGKRAFRRKDRTKTPNPAHNPEDPKPDVPEFLEELVPKQEPARKVGLSAGAHRSAGTAARCRGRQPTTHGAAVCTRGAGLRRRPTAATALLLASGSYFLLRPVSHVQLPDH